MEFTISKNALQKELGFVQGTVEKKNTIPALSNILIESVGENTIRITGTDLDVTLRCEAEAEIKMELAGSGLVIRTPLAVAGPWFVAIIVKVTLFPTTTGSGESVFVTATSAIGVSVSVSVALLFPVDGSVTPPGAVTVAVLLRLPTADGETTAFTV